MLLVLSLYLYTHANHDEQWPEYLVRFLLYAIFGTPDELGFDPTVGRTHTVNSGKTRYDFYYLVKNTVTGKDEIFRTIGDPISEENAYRIVSRATRVWEVRKVLCDHEGNVKTDTEGKPILGEDVYVLKDVWLYCDAQLESEIQNDIFSKLPPNERKDARQYFLEIMHDTVVKCGEKMEADDVTPICTVNNRRTTTWTDPTRELVPHSSSRNQLRGDQRADAKPQPPKTSSHVDRIAHNYSARKHVRTVFKERCKSVFELEDFKSLLQCLLGCIRGVSVHFFVHSPIDLVVSPEVHEDCRLCSSRRQRG